MPRPQAAHVPEMCTATALDNRNIDPCRPRASGQPTEEPLGPMRDNSLTREDLYGPVRKPSPAPDRNPGFSDPTYDHTRPTRCYARFSLIVRKVMRDCVIVEAKPDLAKGVIEYVAASPMFPLVPIGEALPRYELVLGPDDELRVIGAPHKR